MMEAVNQWLVAQSNLRKAASDFLDACTALKAVALQPPRSSHNHQILEIAVDDIYPHITSIELVQNQLRASHTALNVLRNQSAKRVPINRLPPELLSYIFTLAADDPTFHRGHFGRDMNLTNIREVCVLWYRVCANTPRFWSRIDVDLDVFSTAPNIPPTFNRARLWLNRSQGAPIHLYFAGLLGRVSQTTVSELVSVFQPRLTDLESLNISGTHTSDLVRALFAEHSKLGTPGPLKRLTLTNIQVNQEERAIAWPVPSLSGLVELYLGDLKNFASPKLSAIVSLLSNCPALHTLRLTRLAIQADQQRTYPMISLPCLRLLELYIPHDQEEIMHLPPLLAPGLHELDVRLHLPYIDQTSGSDLSFQSLLARSNVTYLTLLNTFQVNIMMSLLSSTPRLRMLVLHNINFRSQEILERLHFGIGSNFDLQLPYLQCLCFVSSHFTSEAIDQVERISAQRSLRSLVFWSCTFFDPQADDRDEEDFTTRAQEPPRSVRDRLSKQVERLVICHLPLPQVHHGVDLVMQALITRE
ncbi:hypothetical protein FS749_002275 [Ceratobasidium sp. UAMH 11750]|nr:hypothetical protein FS749_002275 [Ceratobasidium sp. UAMH 11750]